MVIAAYCPEYNNQPHTDSAEVSQYVVCSSVDYSHEFSRLNDYTKVKAFSYWDEAKTFAEQDCAATKQPRHIVTVFDDYTSEWNAEVNWDDEVFYQFGEEWEGE